MLFARVSVSLYMDVTFPGAGKTHTAFHAVPCVWQLGKTLPRVGAKVLVQPLV